MRARRRQVIAVERQASLLALLAHNARVAGLAAPRFSVLAADVRDADALPRNVASLVLANPPFFPPQARAACGNLLASASEQRVD